MGSPVHANTQPVHQLAAQPAGQQRQASPNQLQDQGKGPRDEDELVNLLTHNLSEEDARALILQVKARDYSPPKRERILEWQAQLDFPICPNAEDPNACNVYRELRFSAVCSLPCK